jgi:hypothetical protein
VSVVITALTATAAMIGGARHHSMRRESPKHVRQLRHPCVRPVKAGSYSQPSEPEQAVNNFPL